jgi:hypothetical protein
MSNREEGEGNQMVITSKLPGCCGAHTRVPWPKIMHISFFSVLWNYFSRGMCANDGREPAAWRLWSPQMCPVA